MPLIAAAAMAGGDYPVIRIMPNTPCAVGAGVGSGLGVGASVGAGVGSTYSLWDSSSSVSLLEEAGAEHGVAYWRDFETNTHHVPKLGVDDLLV